MRLEQGIKLKEVEGRRVNAVDVLPGKEDGLCSYPPRVPDGVGGGKVIRFFIHVHDVGLPLEKLPAEFGIVVQVIVAVEAHLLGYQFVPAGVAAF